MPSDPSNFRNRSDIGLTLALLYIVFVLPVKGVIWLWKNVHKKRTFKKYEHLVKSEQLKNVSYALLW